MMKLKLPDRPLRTPIAHSLRQEIDEIIDYLCQGDLHVFVQELAKIEKVLCEYANKKEKKKRKLKEKADKIRKNFFLKKKKNRRYKSTGICC